MVRASFRQGDLMLKELLMSNQPIKRYSMTEKEELFSSQAKFKMTFILKIHYSLPMNFS